MKKKTKCLINRIKAWNIWRRHNSNSRWYKLLVLLGLRTSPTFMFWVGYDFDVEQIKPLAIKLKKRGLRSTFPAIDEWSGEKFTGHF